MQRKTASACACASARAPHENRDTSGSYVNTVRARERQATALGIFDNRPGPLHIGGGVCGGGQFPPATAFLLYIGMPEIPPAERFDSDPSGSPRSKEKRK